MLQEPHTRGLDSTYNVYHGNQATYSVYMIMQFTHSTQTTVLCFKKQNSEPIWYCAVIHSKLPWVSLRMSFPVIFPSPQTC